jgi:HAD superfamily hydrolase (TIGR01484 family)
LATQLVQRLTPFADISETIAKGIVGIFCDIDDTLTHEGKLVPEAFEMLAKAHQLGLRVIPVTGRPAGWVDQIARMWPVDGVVGENGGLWFYMKDGRLEQSYLQSAEVRQANLARLEVLKVQILAQVPGCAISSDQDYRALDLAIDFCEDVPALPEAAIDQIVACFTDAGATCKVSSIHVNGWFGTFDKLEGCRRLISDRYGEQLDQHLDRYLYFGDSANDEPMFATFPHAVGVSNVRDFLPRMTSWPAYICEKPGGHGFAEAMEKIFALRGR